MTSADPAVATQLRLLREYGWKERYISHIAGMNSRLDPLQAALLAVKLPHLETENRRRQAIAARYTAAFTGSALVLPRTFPGTEPVYHQYVVQHPRREALRLFLKEHQIGSLIHYPVPIHRQPAYQNRLPLPAGPLSRTEAACERILSLPIHGQLTNEQCDRVIAAVNAWLALPS